MNGKEDYSHWLAKEKFCDWLKEEKHITEDSCLVYATDIAVAERFAQIRRLASTRLFTENPDEAVATADALLANNEFVRHDANRHSLYREAITQLLMFYGITWTPKEMSAVPRVRYIEIDGNRGSQQPSRSFDVEMCEAILKKHFCNGYHLSSAIDMKKMRGRYEEMTGEPLDVDQLSLNAALKRRGIVYEGKLYAPESLLSDDTRMRIFSFIDERFAEGRRAVYYDAIYEKLYDELLNSNIRDAGMLKACLTRIAAGKYHFGVECVEKDFYARPSPVSDVREYLMEQGVPVKTADICKALPHISSSRIKDILRQNGEFLSNGASEYFCASSLELDKDELKAIAQLTLELVEASSIEEPKFITVDEMYKAIQKSCPASFEKNAGLSATGWKNALKYKLTVQYMIIGRGLSFGQSIVSRRGGPTTKPDVFKEYARRHKRFALAQLEALAKSVNCATIPFDAVYAYATRISRDEFVSKGEARFSVAETDAVLDRLLGSRQSMRIDDVELAILPDASFAWTDFLLEQYVYSYSEKFRLTPSFNKSYASGLIARWTRRRS